MVEQPLFGLIAPHPPILLESVGGARAEATRSTADALRHAGRLLSDWSPETVVVMSPHAPYVPSTFLVSDADRVSGTLSQFGDSTVFSAAGDPELARSIVSTGQEAGIAIELVTRVSGEALRMDIDHGCLVPLRALELQPIPRVVWMSICGASLRVHHDLGACVRLAASRVGRRVAFIASGDLSHRLTPDAPAGYDPEGERFDRMVVEAVGSGSLSALVDVDPDLVEAAGQCGLRSMVTLAGYLDTQERFAEVLRYEGPWGVGYLTAVLGRAGAQTPAHGESGGMPGDAESEIVSLARASLTAAVTGQQALDRVNLSDPALPARAGAFVTLHRGGELRGCIGTIAPTQPTLALEVARNAVSAALHDPRFSPLTAPELDDLDISVDVLGEPEACTIADLDPKRYGVIVSSGFARGLLLPDLEGVDTVADQVAIATRKAGITPGSAVTLERFTVDRYT